MNLAITARKFKLQDDLRSYIEEKSQKLSRFYENIIDTEVILGWEKQQRYVELKIKVDHSMIVVKEYSEDLRKSFDLLLDKAERQLKRHKAKRGAKEKDIIYSA
ncbi:MAG: ribosome-associated translation inhibitor RaiA [Calditrichia bacterium]|nr:ribosome-associated translation inhibitor RaiA [Calditrichota bacterium]MCB0269480.1 ribosome-associated translation inhibitor RaiA [Calditrichota bacterium]MCB9066243.1 ribosome-associated translation inhibitor RaiA [Calditrichia bacterium]